MFKFTAIFAFIAFSSILTPTTFARLTSKGASYFVNNTTEVMDDSDMTENGKAETDNKDKVKIVVNDTINGTGKNASEAGVVNTTIITLPSEPIRKEPEIKAVNIFISIEHALGGTATKE